MTLQTLNQLPPAAAKEALLRCCGADRWAEALVKSRPYADSSALFEMADRIWRGLEEADWREAFLQHPRIGDIDSLKAKYADTRQWAQGEQAGASDASEEVLQALADGNQRYEAKFGHLFIVCATKKSADDMLAIMNDRLPNPPDLELGIAAEEQRKITRIRLEKMITP